MKLCSSCRHELSQDDRYCPACGAAVAGADATGPYQPAEEASFRAPSSIPGEGVRFAPGEVLAGRFRIVHRIGKGGMGEVYRADDLRLGQAVVLKFLSKNVTDDPKRLEFFHEEVKLSRQIAHPNVCRVYDIAEHEGQPFLSMEYIDGEDLSVLLRRIGRLPPDKGVQIAQQLCAGLAAAHDRGVVHRDLKPANIMIDGKGHARIIDFGLARLVDKLEGGDVRSGTPMYMAPEQLAGREVTARSDLYALGLILYEVFTGRRAFAGGSLDELMRLQEQSSVATPSSIISEIDPAVEKVILRCLEKKPAQRPPSARAVAAALPGGDPLAAALAAGETPSPELVAAAGETGTLPVRTGIMCMAALVAGLVALLFLSPLLHPSVDPDALEPVRLNIAVQDDILAPLGYYSKEAQPTHAVHGLQLRKQSDGVSEWEFWYRQRSGSYLTPTISEITDGPRSYALSMSNPPPFVAGMVSVRTDMQGKLIELLAIPEGAPSVKVSNPLQNLFARAGLSFQDFEKIDEAQELPANGTPPVFADDVAVYRTKSGNSPVRVVAAHDQGRLVYFYAGSLKNGRFADRQFASPGELLEGGNHGVGYNDLLQLIVLLASIFLTLRNVRLGRADRKGAMRFAMCLGGLQMLVWVFGLHHVADPLREWRLLRDFLRVPWLAYFVRHWLYYMALEPYIRRYWPNVLIAWTRAVDGRFRDPLLGQGLLIGCLAGVLVWVICLGVSAVVVNLSDVPALLTIRFDVGSPLRLWGTLLFALSLCASLGVWFLLMLFLLRALLRDTRIAVAAVALLYLAIIGLEGRPFIMMLIFAIWCVGLGLTMTRFGLIAGMAFIFSQQLLEIFPITPNLTAWYGNGTLVALGSIIAVAGYGFYTSTIAGLLQAKQTSG